MQMSTSELTIEAPITFSIPTLYIFREAAGVLGTLKDCPKEVLQGLAFLATSPDAFGPTSGWKQLEVRKNLIITSW